MVGVKPSLNHQVVHSSGVVRHPTLSHYVVYIHTNLIYTRAPKVCMGVRGCRGERRNQTEWQGKGSSISSSAQEVGNVYVAKQETQKNKCCVSLCIKISGGMHQEPGQQWTRAGDGEPQISQGEAGKTKCPTFYRSTGSRVNQSSVRSKPNHRYQQSRSEEGCSQSASPSFVGEAENDLRKENVDLAT